MHVPSIDIERIRMAATVLRRDQRMRQRDVADALGLSEAALVAVHVEADPVSAAVHERPRAVRLRPDWPALVASLEPLGPVMALTRNPSCVHEKTGVYRQASHQGGTGLVLGGAIDLRLFYRHWAHGFAVTDPGPRGLQRSLQFFDAQGRAVHKVFLTADSDVPAWEGMRAAWADPSQDTAWRPGAPDPAPPETADAHIDADGLRNDWAGLRDTHAFFGLLRRWGVTRTQALRLAGPRFARRVPVASLRTLLESAAAMQLPVMVFVGNPGAIQIHTGPVRRIVVQGPWLNVLDPDFNLHLREDAVTAAWLVRKPTDDGTVTSVELFDAQGETIAMVFGQRKPGQPEDASWRALAESLASGEQPCAV